MKKLVNFRLSVFLVLSIIIGILTAYLFLVKSSVTAIITVSLFLSLSIVGLIFMLLSHKQGKGRIILIAIFALISVFSAVNFSINTVTFRDANLNGSTFTVNGRVASVRQTEYGQTVTLSKGRINGRLNGKIKYKIVVYITGEREVELGDNLTFLAPLYDKDIIYEDKFSASTIEEGVKYYAYLNTEDITVNGNDSTIFQKVNIFMRNVLQKGLDKQQFSVAYAMLLGDSSFIDGETVSAFRNAGVAHIFAVSGLHIGILAGAISFVLKKTKCNKYLSAVITVLTLFFYTGVCGFTASSLRAAIMFSTLLLINLFGEKYDGLSSVSIAATLLLLIKPIQLFCVGFQLSFAAAIGIIILAKPIENGVKSRLKFIPKKLISALAVTVSAQIFTMPICLYYFGQTSLISVMINLLFIPVVNVVYVLLLVSTLLGGLTGSPEVCLFIANYILYAIIWLIKIFDYRIFIIGGFTLSAFAILYYVIFLLCAGLVNIRKVLRNGLCIALATIFLVGTITLNAVDNKKDKAFIIGSQTICATVIKSGKENTLIVSDYTANFSLSRLNRLKESQNLDTLNTVIVLGNGRGNDIQNFTTRLSSVFYIEKLVYGGDKKLAQEVAIKESFLHMEIIHAEDDITLPTPFSCRFRLSGCLLDLTLNEQRVGIFTHFGEDRTGYTLSDTYFNSVIATDYTDNIFAIYKPENKICYRFSTAYINAENRGTIKLLFN